MTWLPALAVGAGVLMTAGAGWLDVLVTEAERRAAYSGRGILTALVGIAPTVAGAVILRHRARHPVGLVLVALGLVWSADGLAESFMAYALPRDLPGTDLAFWFVARFGALLLVGLPAVLVLYPHGRLMDGRWRAASIAVLVAVSWLPVWLLLAPDEVVFQDTGISGVDTELVEVPLPAAVFDVALGVGLALAMAALLTALLVLAARHRHASEDDRTRIGWLLWAGIVCVLLVVSMVVFRQGAVSTVALALAVATTSASVAIGILRPDLADIDALVASTLTFAGVAGVLVAVDFTVLAAAGALLGDRLDERDVTVAVLVLAVLVYGPLRSLLGGVVRRLLFGRRADRYDVVSSFAARLEGASTVEEQLPALVAAVASTFKVGYACVEVTGPDGGLWSAAHGRPPAHVQEFAIGYRGEQVGRLVLPRQGMRAQLTRSDQDLLVDLVRQAAIAIRTSLLARELQLGRERLVLSREEDRRRIRRDLHDGLGPVLSGVAMRLDAAGAAVGKDADQARALIRQSRVDITEALTDVRRLVHGLRPPALDDLGLIPALQQQADRLRGSLVVTVTHEGIGPLPAAVEVAAYRIVSEALTNVVRHAEAEHCAVSLRGSGGGLEVSVRDDGRGIPDEVVAGVGLLSLRERAEELGGQCQVRCPAGGGTEVWAWLPLGEGEA